jgi:hypothetical protein
VKRRQRRALGLALFGVALLSLFALIPMVDSTPAASGAGSSQTTAATTPSTASTPTTQGTPPVAGTPQPSGGTPPATSPGGASQAPPPGGPASAYAPVRLNLSNASAAEWEDLSTFQRVHDQPQCAQPPRLSGMVQSTAFEVFAQTRGTHQRSHFAEERAIGDQLHAALRDSPDSPYAGRIDRDPAQVRYARRLVDTLLGDIESSAHQVEVHVYQSDERNAFAMFGGHLYISSHLLQPSPRVIENEAQLFGVVAHEVAHIDRMHLSLLFDFMTSVGAIPGHPNDAQLLVLAQTVFTTPFSRQMEDEADRYALERMMRIGYSPMQFEKLWWNWAPPASAAPRGGGTPAQRGPLDILGQIVVDELEHLTASHSPAAERACAANRLIDSSRAQLQGRRFYVGARNLRERIAAIDQVF